jgi:hypothetical protein
MISRRALEVLTASITGLFGITVVVSSFDNGIGWSSAGVESGTFPLIVGSIVVLGSLYNLVHGWLRGQGIAVTRGDFRRSLALFLPAAVYVAAIPVIGIYVASALYLLGSLRLQSRLPLLRAAIIAVVAAVALYLVFERAFQVSLPHGWLGVWLDL